MPETPNPTRTASAAGRDRAAPGAEGRYRVLLILPSLHGGGAERVAVHLLNRCDPERFDMRMGLLRKAGPYLDEVDGDRLLVSPLGQGLLNFDGPNSASYRPGKLVAAAALAPLNIRLMIRRFRPHVVLSFLKGTNIATYWAMQTVWGRRRPRWIAREGNNAWAVIDDEISNAFGRAFMRGFLRRTYRGADCCLTISDELGRDMAAWLGRTPSNCRSIHNPVDVAGIRARAAEAPDEVPDGPYIVTAGRLEHQKGHDLLIRAFARSAECRGTMLVILGQGSRLAALQQLAAELGVADRVRFPGFVANPWAYFARARLFVLPSRWEGFGNVVAEALATGVPTLVTDCGYGPREIVEHGVSGWVVPAGDADALSVALDRLLGDAELARRLGAAGVERAAAFDVDRIVAAYSDLFAELASSRRATVCGWRRRAPASD